MNHAPTKRQYNGRIIKESHRITVGFKMKRERTHRDSIEAGIKQFWAERGIREGVGKMFFCEG